jgi:hypothetical protein
METKLCKHCNTIKTLDLFNIRSNNKPHTYCKKCMVIYSINRRKYRLLNDPYFKEKYTIDNKARAKAWNKENKDKRKAIEDRYRNTEKYRLTNSYCEFILTQYKEISKEEITPELLDLKRKQLKLYRDVKNKSNTSDKL